MSEWLGAMGPGVGNHLWQSTAFGAVAWGVTLLLRRNSARVRYGIWVVASVKFLVPFSLLIGLGGMLPRPQRPVVAMPVYSAVDEVGLPFSVESVSGTTPVVVHASRMQRVMSSLPAELAAIWVCGVGAVLVVWCRGWLRVMRTLRQAQRVECGREAEILRRVETAIGGRRRAVTLMLSRELMEPGMFGVWRLVLIWPQRLSERLDDEHIEAIVAHELTHARRRDNLTAALHMVVEAAFWFHPMVWWMERRMVEERERACDEAVVAMGSRPGVYAESLLKACRFCVESPLVCVAGITGADLASRVRAIMTRRSETLGLWRKMALYSLGVAAIVGPVAFGVVRMIPMYGQMLHATGPLPAFDVVAIKPSKEPPQGGTTTGEQVHLVVTAKLLIQLAYNVPMLADEQVAGGPEWISTDVFDILAKMDTAKFEAMQNMSRAQKREQQQLMEQSLLADRMKLKMHFETRDLPVYALTTTKGLKLKAATDVAPGGATMIVNPGGDSPRPEDLRRGILVRAKGRGFEMVAKGVTMDGLVHALIPRPELRGRTVVDQTGLKDAYDFTLEWGPESTAAPESGEVELPSLFAAIEQQLGLKLAPAKGPGEVILIDHIEKPVFDSAEAPAQPSAMAPTDVPAAAAMKIVAVALVGQKLAPSGQSAPADPATNIAATWQGTLHTGRNPRFVVRVTKVGDGTLRSTFYNIDGEPGGIPAISTTLNASLLKLELPFATYQGTVSADGNTITGTWRQGPNPLPLNFARATPETEWTIPQPPRLPPMAANANPTFEVATIKPSRPDEHGPRFGGEARRFSVIHASLNDLVDFAYGLQPRQILGAPDWVASESYDISAVPDGDGAPSGKQVQSMVKKLMADRFQFKFHYEKREQAAYVLTVARTGPKLTRSHSDPGGQMGLGFGPPGSFGATNATMADVAEALAHGALDRPVLDRTGLTGKFDLRLTWTPDGSPPATESPDAPPDLFTAIQQQLGLKLESTKAPVDVLVIDHIEKPSQN